MELKAALPKEPTDFTLPGRRRALGKLHPLTQVTDDIVRAFRKIGFAVADGPEIEDEYHCFDALNTPADHPARDSQDTFYIGANPSPGSATLSPSDGERDGVRGSRPAFKYWDKGTMATIGRSAAVAQIGKLKLSGYPAWLAWLFVHLIFLVGFRNRTAVLFQWAYSYFSNRRSARIITHQPQEVEED